MSDTPLLALPLVAAAQSQKHVPVNEALGVLDTLVQLAVLDRDLATSPASPEEGDRFIVAASATGAWAGHVGEVAAWRDAAWRFSVPQTGWLAYVVDEGALVAWTGTSWMDAVSAIASLNNMTLLGVGTTADETNPLSAKLNNALFVAKAESEGGTGDLRYKLSKESAAKTLSFLFQDSFAGRAEFGLVGDDDFLIKVSADGAIWKDALHIDGATGVVSFPSGGGASGSGSGSSGHGQCRLSKSGANLLLSPYGGNKLVIDGEPRTIPGAGVTLAATGLNAGALYYIYAYLNAGTLTLEASATGHSTDADSGFEIKTGDPSRTLVGMARTIPGPAWQDIPTQRFVRSWFNDAGVVLTGAGLAEVTVAAVGYVEAGTGRRVEWLQWAGGRVHIAFSGSLGNNTAGGFTACAVGVDSITTPASPETGGQSSAANYRMPFYTAHDSDDLAEGYHYAAPIWGRNSGTGMLSNAVFANGIPSRLEGYVNGRVGG